MKRTIKWTIVGALMLVVGKASAQEPAFGDIGHVALSAERLFGYVHTKMSTTANGVDTNRSADTVSLIGSNPFGLLSTGYGWPRIAADAFVAKSISIGGALAFFNISPETGSITGFLLAPRVGYAAFIGPRLVLWPRGGITYEHVSTDNGGITITQSLFALTIEAPLAFLVVPRVAFLVGPTLDLGLSGSTSSGGMSLDQKITDFGLQASLLVLL